MRNGGQPRTLKIQAIMSRKLSLMIWKRGTARTTILHWMITQALSAKVKARFQGAYSGHFRARFIDGIWAGASGLIYPTWGTRSNTTDVSKQAPRRYTIAMDYGIAGVFCCLMIGEYRRGAAILGELYHDARTQVPLSNNQLVDKMKAWQAHWVPETAKMTVTLDPATPISFKRILRGAGYIVRNAQNNVLDGIIVTSARLESGNVFIPGDSPNLKEELQGYSWDSDALNRGIEQPLKGADHCVDALRYYCNTYGKRQRFAGKN